MAFLSINWVRILRSIWHKIGHFGDVLPSQSLGVVLQKTNLIQQKHKQTTTQNNLQKPNLTQINCNTQHNHRKNLDLTNKQLLGLFIRVCIALCTNVAHNTAQNHTHTHTPQPFYGPFSGTTRVSRCQKRTSGLYGAREADILTIRLGATPSRLTSAYLHHPPIFFTGRMPFLPPNQQYQSTEGN